jgi:hypothetical protein
MKAHKLAIKITLPIAILSFTIYIFLVVLGTSFNERPYCIDLVMNMLLAIWGSDVIVLVLEVINYQESKTLLMYDFIFECGRIVNIYKKIRYCLQEKREDFQELRQIYIEISNIDIYPLYILHNSFSFFLCETTFYEQIERVSLQIKDFYNEVVSQKDLLLFSENADIVKEIIGSLNEKYEKEEVIGVGSVRLTDIIKPIESDILLLQEKYFKVKMLPIK